MAIRIPWDKHEAAILLDACLAVINGKISRTDAVLMVSQTLRENAIRNGKTIDSVYRNENGISMQMNIMTALILETSSGLHGASKLFIDIVHLYKNNCSQFQKILEEAKKGETTVAYEALIHEEQEDDELHICATGASVSRPDSDARNKDDFSDVDFDRYKEILSRDYRKGFQLNDKLSVRRFRIQWKEFFKEELPYDDELIWKHIAYITVQHGDMVYLPEVMLDENTKHKLLAYIKSLFDEGKSIIYYEALYKKFSDDFASSRINNVEMLKTYLAYINDGQMWLHRNYIAVDRDVKADSADEVRSFLTSGIWVGKQGNDYQVAYLG